MKMILQTHNAKFNTNLFFVFKSCNQKSKLGENCYLCEEIIDFVTLNFFSNFHSSTFDFDLFLKLYHHRRPKRRLNGIVGRRLSKLPVCRLIWFNNLRSLFIPNNIYLPPASRVKPDQYILHSTSVIFLLLQTFLFKVYLLTTEI